MRSLLSVPVGSTARLGNILLQESLKNRLIDLGLTAGCPIRCLYAAPCGDPRAYWVRGTVIAIRNCDAKGIEVYEIWD